MNRIVVIGGSGFLGSAIVSHARELGLTCRAHPSIRVPPAATDVWPGAGAWRRENASLFDSLRDDLEWADAVVNAAGLASPGSPNRAELHAANAVQPAVVALAAGAAGVRRLVHVSTAAVQGRRDPLDETGSWEPLSPYAQSKADGERALLAPEDAPVPSEIVVYRPTSVHGVGRAVTRRLARWATTAPVMPVAGYGDQPVPVALVQNVAAGVLFAVTAPMVQQVVLQPSEGLTVRALFELFGARRILPLPHPVVGVPLRVLAQVGRGSAPLVARLRRVELLALGQGSQARHLVGAGFRLPAGIEGWQQLAAWAGGHPQPAGPPPSSQQA